MNLELSEEQQLMRDSFARFLGETSSIERVRAARPSGFDPALWTGLADLGAFSIRVSEGSGGLNLGTLDAAVLMEEAGRTLASGPLAETIVAARLLDRLGGSAQKALLEDVIGGRKVVTIAYHDAAKRPVQWISGGSVSDGVIARFDDEIVLISVDEKNKTPEPTLASTPIAELDLAGFEHTRLSSGAGGLKAFSQALEEWKLLLASALSGLAREAVGLASEYARERVAFGQPIGTYQGISHPLADLITDIDGGKF